MIDALVVDAHHHFWDPFRVDYPWMTDELAAIRREFGPDDLRPLLTENGVDRTVLVQTRSSLEETREFLQTAESAGFVAGVVGWADLTAPGVAGELERLRQAPGGNRLVGIRHQVHDEPDPRWLCRLDVRRGLAAVEEADLAYDLLVRAPQLPAALESARVFPALRFVVDHAAKPRIAGGQVDQEWADALSPLADLPNVTCKLSGLVTEAHWKRWTAGDLEPYVRSCLDWFGEDRLLFGSDWPVCLLASSYSRWVETLRELLSGVAPEAIPKVFGANAIRVYRLERGI